MTRSVPTAFILAGLALLGACGSPKPSGGGTTTMRDMEVVDGTANDSMADLDNATGDGTLLDNAGMLPPVGAVAAAGNAATATANAVGNSNAAE